MGAVVFAVAIKVLRMVRVNIAMGPLAFAVAIKISMRMVRANAAMGLVESHFCLNFDAQLIAVDSDIKAALGPSVIGMVRMF